MLACPTSLSEVGQKPVRKVALTRDLCSGAAFINTCSMSWENAFPIVHEDRAHFSVTLHNCRLFN